MNDGDKAYIRGKDNNKLISNQELLLNFKFNNFLMGSEFP